MAVDTENPALHNCAGACSNTSSIAPNDYVFTVTRWQSNALTINRLCSSGLYGVVNTAQQVMLGDIQYGAGGGVEVMSKGGYMSPNVQFG